MASIRENKRNGKTISYRFTACLERDEQGKQVRQYTTWTPAAGLTPSKAERAIQRENWRAGNYLIFMNNLLYLM